MAFYDFASLSPSDFEALVADLLNAEHGWQMESFATGPDGGVDLRGQLPHGVVVVQCKHYDRSSIAELVRAARDEKAKMDQRRPTRYLFVTSQELTLTQKDRVAAQLQPWLASTTDLLARSDLNRILARHPEVERRHFKLWLASADVLARIAQSATWARSAALVEDLQQRVRVYVNTNAYQRAVDTLNQSNMVVITGAPGVGKSTLADMLTVNLWSAGWQVVSVSADVDQAWQAYRPGQRQVFLYDDFLGETDLSEALPKNEAARLAELIRQVGRTNDKRLIMTTRRHQLRQMLDRSEKLSRAGLLQAESIVEIDDYGPLDRARILYNHLYFCEAPRDLVDGFVRSGEYRQVLDHPNFAPRLVADTLRWRHDTADELLDRFRQAMDRPHGLWAGDFSRQPASAQKFLLALASYVGEAPERELRQISLRSQTPLQYNQMLKALEGVWITLDQPTWYAPDSELSLSYANPSCRDFILSLIDEIPDYLLEIADGAVNPASVFTLLGYASSQTDGTATFPGLAELAGNPVLHARWFALLVRQQAACKSRRDTDSFYDNLERASRWAGQLGDHEREWLDQQHEAFRYYVPLTADEWVARTTAEDLLQDLHDGLAVDAGALANIVERWAASIAEDDDVAALYDFCTRHAALLGDSRAMFDAFKRGLGERVTWQSTQVINGSEDHEIAREWLAELEQLVITYDLDRGLLDEIGRVRAKASAIAADPEQLRLDAAIEAWYAAGCPDLGGDEPREPSTAELTDQIDALFAQLAQRHGPVFRLFPASATAQS